jgi:hypothetical protein
MQPSNPDCDQRSLFSLCFRSLLDARRAYAFPCDAVGSVDMDALGEEARNDYLFARACVGRKFSRPEVESRIGP